MTVDHVPQGPLPGDNPPEGYENPVFRAPFTDHDRGSLIAREGAGTAVLTLLEAAEGTQEQIDATSLTPQEQLSALRALELARRRIDAMSADILAAFDRSGTSTDHGYRTTEALLQGEFRISVHEARRRARLSRQLGERITLLGEKQAPAHPRIAENYAEGRISTDEARTLCDAVEDLPPQVKDRYEEQIEQTLVELAPGLRLADIPKLVGRIVQTVDPDGTPPQFTPEPHRYHVTVNQKVNGDWRLSGLLDCPTGTTLYSLLYARMRDTDAEVTLRPHPRAPGNTRMSANTGEPEDTRASEGTRPPESSLTDTDTAQDENGTCTAGTATDASAASASAGPPSADEPAAAPPADVAEAARHAGPSPRPASPEEAVWERTDVTVDAEGWTTVSGGAQGEGALVEDDPLFLMREDGWPVPISPRISHAAFALFEEAGESESGSATTVLWEKTLGRTACPGEPQDGGRRSTGTPGGTEGPPERTPPERMPTATHPPPESSRPSDDRALQPVQVGTRNPGVCEDGSRSTVLPEPDSHSPGRNRHDRLSFLLRCLSRERVLHGADHALVVSAHPRDLAHARRPLFTQTGGVTTQEQLAGWSHALQLFAHVADGSGRTIAVRSHGRFATRSQMAVLTARDQGCTFPDCDAPAAWCEAHHLIPFAEGGPTDLGNLTLVCPFHHRWFERSGWSGQMLRGLPAWTPPSHLGAGRKPIFHSRFRAALLSTPPFTSTPPLV